MKSLSIVIPVYNEAKNIAILLDRVLAVKITYKKEIIIVNDGSTDETEEKIQKFIQNNNKEKIIYLSKINGGKGSAVKMGFEKATGDILLIQDGDLETYPEDYPALLQPFESGAKVVYGSRIKGPSVDNRAFYYLGGRFVSFVASVLYFTWITDQPNCFKIHHKDLKPLLLNTKSNGFDWEAEITAKVLKKGFKIIEVPVRYKPRMEGKKLSWKDGFKMVWALIKYRI